MRCKTPMGFYCKEHQIRHTPFWSWLFPFIFNWDKFQRNYNKKDLQGKD